MCSVIAPKGELSACVRVRRFDRRYRYWRAYLTSNLIAVAPHPTNLARAHDLNLSELAEWARIPSRRSSSGKRRLTCAIFGRVAPAFLLMGTKALARVLPERQLSAPPFSVPSPPGGRFQDGEPPAAARSKVLAVPSSTASKTRTASLLLVAPDHRGRAARARLAHRGRSLNTKHPVNDCARQDA